MGAALKIVRDVVAWRIANLEMANLAGSLSIALALRLRPLDVAVRIAFAFLLNVLVYLNNDTLDVALDLQSDDKSRAKTSFLAEHLSAARAAQAVLAVLLVAIAALWDLGLFVPLLLGGGICVLYSSLLKRTAWFDVAAMVAWGVAMPLCGTPIGNPLGWAMAVQLGLFAGVFECLQVMRDAPDDAAQGLRTTGVVLGHRRTLLLARALMAAASAWSLVVLSVLAAAVSGYAVATRVEEKDVGRAWTSVKVIYGVAWLAICAVVLLHGRSAGLMASVVGVPLPSGVAP